MIKTKVFKSGNSQAVRLPKGFTFNQKEIEIFKRNNEIILREIPKDLTEAFTLFTELPDDFYTEGRDDALPQDRGSF